MKTNLLSKFIRNKNGAYLERIAKAKSMDLNRKVFCTSFYIAYIKFKVVQETKISEEKNHFYLFLLKTY